MENICINDYGINYNKMLQFRKYMKNLPKKYRKGIRRIEETIREIDSTSIDFARGSINIKEISEKLQEEGSCNKKAIISTLSDMSKDISPKELTGNIPDDNLDIKA